MSINLVDHPAVRLGAWLRDLRQMRGFVKRVFAAHISLSPSKYCEVEAGVVRWIEDKHDSLIVSVLDMTREEVREWRAMLKAARNHLIKLTFSDVFRREQLEPVRLRHDGGAQLKLDDRELILNAVFTPIE